MEVSGRFVISGILTLLLLATGGCSFKKNPASGHAQVIVVEEKARPLVLPSIEEIIAGEDEEAAIEQLAERKSEVDGLAKNTSASAIDFAIKYKKTKILSYLLISGHSPFVLNQDSREKIGYDQELNSLIKSAQKESFDDIIASHRQGLAVFYARLEEYQLGPGGCEDLADTLVKSIYTAGASTQSVFLEVVNSKVCSPYKDRFSLEKISEWISFEYFYQFQSAFKDTSFLATLMTLKKLTTISIMVPAGGWHSDQMGLISSHVEVSPVTMLMLKKPCFQNDTSFDKWLDVATRLINPEVGAYSYPYVFSEGLNGAGQYCGEEKKYCSENDENIASMWALFRYQFPDVRLSKAQFQELYSGRSLDSSSTGLSQADGEKFRAELCSLPERRSQ
ncbi:hypothetical protein EZJ49_03130 [Bdellovibrio bacteriovorus]|uniref:hypothetical protein n=1 Tax=Bdellovibrio bacteriovorus TaxID=959 RepID=UPI0021D1AB3C|nr:hypothetical protein [Bdellovibrio bacteriovorus]UXR65242.1 hypothetical protein EZJ49_03130 [Bdellovibrio bacteriovorus]